MGADRRISPAEPLGWIDAVNPAPRLPRGRSFGRAPTEVPAEDFARRSLRKSTLFPGAGMIRQAREYGGTGYRITEKARGTEEIEIPCSSGCSLFLCTLRRSSPR